MKKKKLSKQLTWNYIFSKDFKVILGYFLIMIFILGPKPKIENNFWQYLQLSLRSINIIGFTIGITILYETIKYFYIVCKNENFLLRYSNKYEVYNEFIKASIKIGLIIFLEYILSIICISFFKGYTVLENVVDKSMYGLNLFEILIVQIIRNVLFIICMQFGTVLLLDKLKKKELVVVTILMIYILIPFSFYLQGNKVVNFFLPTAHLNTWGVAKTFWGNILSDLLYYLGILIILFVIKKKNFSKSKMI